MSTTNVWSKRYAHECPSAGGEIITIAGIGRKDTYNVAMCETAGRKVLALRTEQRRSFAWRRRSYHPAVYFATEQDGAWRVDQSIEPFDMLEDPFFVEITESGKRQIIFGCVRIRREGHSVIPCTELYKGDTLKTLERTPFMVTDNMKDIRLMQLPDKRFLLCRRPWGGDYGRGRITLHVAARLEDIANPKLKTLNVLSNDQSTGWTGVNSAHLLRDTDGEQWIGLLGHVAFEDATGKHYAACTYKMPLQDLLAGSVRGVRPYIIASRSCFPAAPAKRKGLRDVVFPGHLELLNGQTYRLWAGLSDARIGTLEIENPFQLNK